MEQHVLEVAPAVGFTPEVGDLGGGALRLECDAGLDVSRLPPHLLLAGGDVLLELRLLALVVRLGKVVRAAF